MQSLTRSNNYIFYYVLKAILNVIKGVMFSEILLHSRTLKK